MDKIYNMSHGFLESSSEPTDLTAPRYTVTWKTLFLPILGLVVFFAYLYVFQVDILEIIGIIQKANLYFYALATIATLLDALFFTLAWHSLLDFLSVRIHRSKLFLFVWVGVFVDTLIPAESVSGEISKIYLVNREHDGSAGKATASIVVQRLIGMSINIATLVVGAVLLFAESQLYGTLLILIMFLVALTFLFLMLILLLCVKENWTMRIVESVIRFAEWVTRGRWKPSKFREEVMKAAIAFHSAIREYAHAPKTLFTSVSFSVISWSLTLVVFYLTFLSIGYPQISWSAILVISSIFVAVKSIPMGVPFEVGLPEIALTTLLSFFGVPWRIGATATILMRLLTLWLRFSIGFGAQQWIGFKAIRTSKEARVDLTQK